MSRAKMSWWCRPVHDDELVELVCRIEDGEYVGAGTVRMEKRFFVKRLGQMSWLARSQAELAIGRVMEKQGATL